MPLGFHGLDLVVILVIALLIFGPKKLPEMGSAIGKSIKEFRKGMNELTAPKDEHAEENKLPVSAANEMGKLNATVVESNAPLNTSTVTSEVHKVVEHSTEPNAETLNTSTVTSEVHSAEVKID